MERIFPVIGVLCVLCMCTLGIENQDVLVVIYENWLDDPRNGFVFPRGNVVYYFNVEADY